MMQRSLKECLALHLEALRDQHAAEATYNNRRHYVEKFIEWCEPRGVWRAHEVTKHVLQRYQRHLRTYVAPKRDKPLSVISQHMHLSGLRMFFKYLAQENYILFNPAAELVLPKVRKALPKSALTAREMEAVLMIPDTGEWVGLRDRTILETFYSTGIRRAELARLKLCDVDFERGIVWVKGKGGKERVVPIGKRALQWIEKYLLEVRPQLVMPHSQEAIFLNYLGKPVTNDMLSEMVRGYLRKSRIAKRGGCHVIRHTVATLMLENGADIRYVQALLGHADLNTTQIYTQVSIKALKRVHEETHPAKATRAQIATDAAREALLDAAEGKPFTAEDLLSDLAAEAAEESNLNESVQRSTD